MPVPTTISAGYASSGSRLFVRVGGKRSLGLTPVTGKKAATAVLRRMQLLRQQQHPNHTWVSGHPHNLLYKPPTSGNKAHININGCSIGGSSCGINGSHASPNNSGNTASSFLDFAGNSRYQAYHLARFSTLSTVSYASSSSSSSSTPSKQEPGSAASSSSHPDRAHSNPAVDDTKSPPSLTTTTTTTATGSPQSSKDHHDDKEDDWAVNESFSGHSGHGYASNSTSSSDSESGSISSSNPSISRSSSVEDDDDTSEYDSTSTALQPSLSSFKTPATIEASWRRTSETLPSVTVPPGSSILPPATSTKAGGLDLSSSTLVQQMLFRERAPHAKNSESDAESSSRNPSDEGNSLGTNAREKDTVSADHEEDNNNNNDKDFQEWDDDVDRLKEQKHSHA
ncbi:hypothetical protein B0O80DRAFT_448432 [Mortierella sp. GBAus27b]|nr:hypothetical protein BGX31_003064 [Mortierella sp. GBA43]KAI8355971.1 hypothetical protein B0O80DRAFT_448432 [Mortierella sp. GBAus27b]